MKFESRLVTRYDLPLADGAAILHPEQVVLCFGGDASIDIGAYCFLKRSPESRIASQINIGRLVDISSFSEDRASQVGKLIKFISDDIGLAGARPMSTHSWVSNAFIFLDWADANGYPDVLGTKLMAKTAFRQYVKHLRQRVNQDELLNNSAAKMQNHVLKWVINYIGLDNPHHGLNLLRISKSAGVPTSPPSEDSQAKVLGLCTSLFSGFCDLVLNNRPYPYFLKVPDYLAVVDGGVWVFPNIKWTMPKHEVDDRNRLKYAYWAYNYFEGRISTVDEIAHHYANHKIGSRKETYSSRDSAATSIKLAKACLLAGNTDVRNIHRRTAALNAHNAFVVMFMANTAMNWSCIRDLQWGDTYEVGVEQQGFRTIKWRARGRAVSFEIQAIFLPTFRWYLKLRAYLLDGVTFDRLFLTCNLPGIAFEPLKVKTQTTIFQMLRRIDPSIPILMSKQWRAGKSDWLLRHADPATTALILQNSEEAVRRSYSAGSETTHMEEMSSFFEQVESTVINRGQADEHSIDRPVGVCSSFGNPHQFVRASVESDCKGSEGCLFCDKFKVHADECDTRKLLSCRFCLRQTAHLTSSEEHQQALFGPIFERIEQILSEINHRAPGMVEKICMEVERDGELDKYWAGKFSMLAELELIA